MRMRFFYTFAQLWQRLQRHRMECWKLGPIADRFYREDTNGQ